MTDRKSTSRPALTPRMRIFTAAWIITALLAIAILVGSWKGQLVWFRGGNPFSGGLTQYSGFNILSGITSLVTVIICLFLSTLLFIQRRQDPMVLFVSFYVMAYGIIFAGPLENLDYLLPGVAGIAISIIQPLFICIPTVWLIVLLPDGHLVPGWTRWLLPTPLLALAFFLFVSPSTLVKLNNPLSLLWAATILVILGLAFAAQVIRYRRFSTPGQRVQMRWVVFGIVIWLIMLTVQSIPFVYQQNLPPGVPQPAWAAVSTSLWWLTLAIIPITLTIATLRYRLYNIDLIINRTLVYGSLTAVLAGMYSASITLFQRIFIALTGQKSDAAIVLTTLILATTLSPIKTRLQAIADRRFKDSHDPMRHLQDFTRQVSIGIWILDRPLVLTRLLEESMSAMEAGGGMLSWVEGGTERPLVTLGKWKGEARLTLPLHGSDHVLGHLYLGPRRDEKAYLPGDEGKLSPAVEAVVKALDTKTA